MNINRIWAVYFSATGTTEKVVTRVAEGIAEALDLECETYDFTLPGSRENVLSFSANELVVLGTPVYAGRVPNVLLKYLDTIQGNGAIAVPIVLFGNRNYDDALIELRDIVEKDGFHTVAGAAFVGEHAFSYTLGKGRPDQADIGLADEFARRVARKVEGISDRQMPQPVEVTGIPNPYRGYYTPRDRQGVSVDLRKVKPVTGDACNNCMICAQVCPMGSISLDDVREYNGICIKCGACIKKCPQQARYYDDAAYLYHKNELEEGYTRRAEPEFFF